MPTIRTIADKEPAASLPPDVLREAIDQVAFAAGFRLATRTVTLPEPVAR